MRHVSHAIDAEVARLRTPDLIEALQTIRTEATQTRVAIARGHVPKGSTALRRIEVAAADALTRVSA